MLTISWGYYTSTVWTRSFVSPMFSSPQNQSEVYRGGTTYYPPHLQQPSARSPARRPKVAIPIVDPQVSIISRYVYETNGWMDVMRKKKLAKYFLPSIQHSPYRLYSQNLPSPHYVKKIRFY